MCVKFDINTATLAQIKKVDGIGNVLAKNIIKNRPYDCLDDILKLKIGIGVELLANMKKKFYTYPREEIKSNIKTKPKNDSYRHLKLLDVENLKKAINTKTKSKDNSSSDNDDFVRSNSHRLLKVSDVKLLYERCVDEKKFFKSKIWKEVPMMSNVFFNVCSSELKSVHKSFHVSWSEIKDFIKIKHLRDECKILLSEDQYDIYKKIEESFNKTSDEQIENEQNENKSLSNYDASSKKIPHALRYAVWKEYASDRFLEAKCYCCRKNVISMDNFICGHVKSKKDGGEHTLENLRAICTGCNSSMGSQHMFEFIEKYGLWNGKNNKEEDNKKDNEDEKDSEYDEESEYYEDNEDNEDNEDDCGDNKDDEKNKNSTSESEEIKTLISNIFSNMLANMPTVKSTEAPIKTPTEAPIKTPTEAPIKTPTEAPTEAPIKAPIEVPTTVPDDTLPNTTTKINTNTQTKSSSDNSAGIPINESKKETTISNKQPHVNTPIVIDMRSLVLKVIIDFTKYYYFDITYDLRCKGLYTFSGTYFFNNPFIINNTKNYIGGSFKHNRLKFQLRNNAIKNNKIMCVIIGYDIFFKKDNYCNIDIQIIDDR